MFAEHPHLIDLTASADAMILRLENIPKGPAVFAIWPAAGEPYLGKTNDLSRRLNRLLRNTSQPSRILRLQSVAQRLEYWPTGSKLESSIVLYDLAKRHMQTNYIDFLKLRMPSYIQLLQSNAFPRTQITSKIGRGPSQNYGPFRTRATAEEFERGFLDLFQLRRCQEDLQPRPDHPGCIYGEMNMCLRPCQQMVGVDEYASEVARVHEFLSTGGRQLMHVAEAARDRLSSEMAFEEAARQHKRMERIEQVLKLRDTLACDIDVLNGVAVTPSATPSAVKLWFVLGGFWQSVQEFEVGVTGDKSVSMDYRLREAAARLLVERGDARTRQEHMALLARWFYSSWRDGEWVPFEGLEKLSYRKLTGAVSRVARVSF